MKRLTPQDIYHSGQHIGLDMMEPDKGKWPISRTKEGIVCVIDFGSRDTYAIGSTWDCKILQVHVNKLVVKPIRQVESASSNEYMMKLKLEKLATKRPEKKEKFRVGYQFCTKVEQLKQKVA